MKYISIPPILEDLFLERDEFVPFNTPLYPIPIKKLKRGEIGIFRNMRIIVECKKEKSTREDLARAIQKDCKLFLPYYDYGNKYIPENEIGSILGCKVIMK